MDKPRATPKEARRDGDSVSGQSASDLMERLGVPLETLANLIYLALQRADNAELVRRYMGMAEEQMAIVRGMAREAPDCPESS